MGKLLKLWFDFQYYLQISFFLYVDNGVKSKTAEVELVEPLLSARESGPMADGKDIDSEVANCLAVSIINN